MKAQLAGLKEPDWKEAETLNVFSRLRLLPGPTPPLLATPNQEATILGNPTGQAPRVRASGERQSVDLEEQTEDTWQRL